MFLELTHDMKIYTQYTGTCGRCVKNSDYNVKLPMCLYVWCTCRKVSSLGPRKVQLKLSDVSVGGWINATQFLTFLNFLSFPQWAHATFMFTGERPYIFIARE